MPYITYTFSDKHLIKSGCSDIAERQLCIIHAGIKLLSFNGVHL